MVSTPHVPRQTAPPSDVVAAVDGSELSLRALRGAALIARDSGARLHVIHAVQGPGSEDLVMDAVSAELGSQPHELMIREVNPTAPDPARVIVAYASEVGTPIVALGTHGRGSLGTALLGSTARDLLTSSDVPLLAYGPNAARPIQIERVIACVDGSEFSELTLGEGSAWAASLSVPLWLVQVVPPGLPSYVAAFENSYVHNLSKEFAGSQLKVEWEVLHSMEPAKALLEMFGEDPANLIVMATHGRKGLERMRLGSVTSDVIHHSWGPLIVIPPGAAL